MRKRFVMVWVFLVFFSCNSNQDRRETKKESYDFEVTLSEVEYIHADDLNSTLSLLDSTRDFFDINDKHINILYVRQLDDSVMFDFSIYPRDNIQLLIDDVKDYKTMRYLKFDKKDDILLIDKTGMFVIKNSSEKLFDFGSQEAEYAWLFDVTAYQYYLNNEGLLRFQSETWFSVL